MTATTSSLSIAAIREDFPALRIDDGHDMAWHAATGRSPDVAAVIHVDDEVGIDLALAAARKYGFKLHPYSSGRNWGYGVAAGDERMRVMLDLGAMQRILAFDDTCGLVTIEAGVTQGQLVEFLRCNGDRWLVSVTGSSPECSVVSNTLERGFGAAPYTDHFSAVRGLNAILPNGSRYAGTAAAVGAWQSAMAYRWDVGPYLYGLFSQSHFGIVSSMTIALCRRQVPALLAFQVEASSLAGAIDAAREMRLAYGEQLANIKFISPQYAAAIQGEDSSSQRWIGLISLHLAQPLRAPLRRALSRDLKRAGFRSVQFTPRTIKILQQTVSKLPQGWTRRLRRSLEGVAIMLRFASGRTSDDGLALAYTGQLPAENANPARDGRGILWYSPTLRFEGSAATALAESCASVFREHGFPAAINFTAIDGHALCGVMAILFDPARDQERAEKCYADLLAAGLAQGCLPYRLPAICQVLPGVSGNHAPLAALLHKAIDPTGIFAPHRFESIIIHSR